MYVRTAHWREQELTSGWVLRNFGTPTPCICSPTVRTNPMGEFQEWWRATNQARAGGRKGGRDGGRDDEKDGGSGGWYLETTTIYPRVYQSWHFAWKSISTVRRCHIVRAILPVLATLWAVCTSCNQPMLHNARDPRWAVVSSAIHASRIASLPLPLSSP